MTDIPEIVPQKGEHDMTVDDLVFHKHELAYGAELTEQTMNAPKEDNEDILSQALKVMPPHIQKSMQAWNNTLKSATHAVVVFENGASVSVITGVPEYRDPENGEDIVMFAKGDARVPTYEVAFTRPDGEETILPYQTRDEVTAILSRMASLPSVGKYEN
jgi:hypothetical protein